MIEQSQYTKVTDSVPKNRFFRLFLALLAGCALTLTAISDSYAGDSKPASPTSEQAGAGSPTDPPRKEVVLWTFQAPGLPAETIAGVHEGLKASLTGEGGRHLFGEKAFRAYVAETSAPLPKCLQGLEPCVSPQALAFDALRLTLVIHVDITRKAKGLQASYALVDRRGAVSHKGKVAAKTARDLAFALAGDIFNATATVSVHSQPAGAEVAIDGEAVGTTPLSYRLPVGTHRYTMRLADFKPVQGSFELHSTGEETVRRTLTELPAVLVFEDAPKGARVFVDGKDRGPASRRLELTPGTYKIEVRADGYDRLRTKLALSAGQVVHQSARLEKSHPLLKDIATNAIAVNSYIGRLSFEQSFHSTTFRDARGELDGTKFEFSGFSDKKTPLGNEDLRRFTDPNGFRLDFTYSWKNFGLVLLSTSYASSSLNLKATVDSSNADAPVAVTVTDMKRLQLRPLEIRYRYFYKNLAPFVELGTGINFQWISVKGDLLDKPVTLSNSQAFWTLGLGGSYYFTPNVFGMVRYGAQFYFDSGLGTEHVLSIGAGVALPNLFGFEPEPPEKL